MSTEYKKDPNALTENPSIHVCWRTWHAVFCDADEAVTNTNDRHLTNYQDLILRLHEIKEANKASAHANANAELIGKLRKKIKKAKRALK